MGRGYARDHALAHALDRVGERWALMVMAEVLAAPGRFAALQERLQIPEATLARRLTELEHDGLLERRREARVGGIAYEATELARELEPAIRALCRWGLRWSLREGQEFASRGRWCVLPLRALLTEPVEPGPLFDLLVEGDPVTLDAREGRVDVRAAPAPTGGIRILTPRRPLLRLAAGEIDAGTARAQGMSWVWPADAGGRLERLFGAARHKGER